VTGFADDLRHALDPVAWCKERLGLELDQWQADAVRSTAPGLLFCCSRQAGKSTTGAVLVSHMATFAPESLSLLLSPALRQSGEGLRNVAGLLARAGVEVSESSKTSLVLSNGSRVLSLPANEGTIRGYSSVNLIVEDEAARVPDDTNRSTRPMLAVSGGRHVLMSTPNGKRGHFWDAWNGEPGWERLQVTAQQCPRIPAAFLAQERRALGPRWFAQEYECSFEEGDAQLFNFDVVMRALANDVPVLFGPAGCPLPASSPLRAV